MNYYYDGKAGELTPEETKQCFLESPISDWIEDEGVWGSKVHMLIRVDPPEEGGYQILLYMDTPIAEVVFTEGARGIVRNIPVDVVPTTT